MPSAELSDKSVRALGSVLALNLCSSTSHFFCLNFIPFISIKWCLSFSFSFVLHLFYAANHTLTRYFFLFMICSPFYCSDVCDVLWGAGLDSSNASRVVDILSALASAGMTVIITIHQPRPDILRLMDRMLLLSGNGQASIISAPLPPPPSPPSP